MGEGVAFSTEDLQALILGPTISDLMINGTTDVYADRGRVNEHIPLSNEYRVERLEAAIQRVARMMGQDLTHQNPILNTRMPDESRVAVVGAPSVIAAQRSPSETSISGSRPTIRATGKDGAHHELILRRKEWLVMQCRIVGRNLPRHHKRPFVMGCSSTSFVS